MATQNSERSKAGARSTEAPARWTRRWVLEVCLAAPLALLLRGPRARARPASRTKPIVWIGHE